MSKLSFRARALDATKPMPVYKSEEIPDLPDFAAINRAVPQMPTGMEKEEEAEHHLQRALSAQQVYGSSEVLVIPTPEIEVADAHCKKLYQHDYKQPKQYIHVQAFSMEQEIPDYDMDSGDEVWLEKQVKKMEITPLQFEEMMDRLEKGSGQQVVTLQEAKLLLKEDDDLIISVYDYWLNKRLKTQQTLIPQVKTEKRDGSTTNNPYVAFRRRTEKMQTRKNRKNDEASYEKMLKLRRDLSRAVTLLEMIKRREKTKKELLQLTIEIVDKRYHTGDWSGQLLAEAQAQRHKIPSFLQAIQNQYAASRDWSNREESGYIRKKREYKKRKHKQSSMSSQQQAQTSSQLPQYHHEIDILHTDGYSSEDDLSPALSPSDHEDDNDPDGIYAFKRKKGCTYLAPISMGNWSWHSNDDGGLGDKRYRYSLTSLSEPRRCIGYGRRRVGRGGRFTIDRGFSPWDDPLNDIELQTSTRYSTGEPCEFASYIHENRLLHFRPRTPPPEEVTGTGTLSSPITPEFNVESFQSHQEQLLQMQREQQEQLLRYQSTDLDNSLDLEHSFSSQPTSRFTLDSATAQFAASAVVSSTSHVLLQNTSTGATSNNSNSLLTNGPILDNKNTVLSSPATAVLQLNYPVVTGTTTLTDSPSTQSNVKTVSSPSLIKLSSTTNPPSNNFLDGRESPTSVSSLVKESAVPMEVT